jgi:hypothetical protein
MDADSIQKSGSWLTESQSTFNGEFHRKIVDLIEFWTANRGPDGVPDRSSFAPDNLRSWIGNISIYEKIATDNDFRIRLEGTKIVQITGEDWTGRRVSEIDARYGTHFLGDVGTVLSRRQPSVSQCRVFQRVFKPAERALLPIASRPGQVDQVFFCLYVVDG